MRLRYSCSKCGYRGYMEVVDVDTDESDGFTWFTVKCPKCGEEWIVTPSMVEA